MRNKTIIAILPLMILTVTFSENFVNYSYAQEELGSTEIIYSINIGKEKYLIHFDVWAGEQQLQSPTVQLESELETIEFHSTKKIPPNSCQSIEHQISAKYTNLVTVKII